MQMLNNIGLKEDPCHTPFLQSQKSVSLSESFTAHEFLEYMPSIMFRKDPFTLTADNFVNNPSCYTELYAFLKSTKHP